ncbi:hypothetical protein GCM10007854_13330 [Algimonas porphyrae]|uniref:Uncharacterized protein n=1 Tax=Algimonas porphyrae TaxID=1128113 RepID=A0ABQ5V0P5_9PROT|nr:hypothetical protein GCM10007854_13330 [Algimonas porphyrae]
MAKRKRRQRLTKPVLSPIMIAAEASLTAEAREHFKFRSERFAERDLEQGTMDGARMRRVACARALEGLVVKQHKASAPFLDPVHAQAASIYQGDLDACHGGQSHEIVERVHMSGSPDMAQCYQIDCLNRVARIGNRMCPDQNRSVRLVLEHRNQSLSRLWPNRAQRNAARYRIRDGLDWLAQEYGLKP